MLQPLNPPLILHFILIPPPTQQPNPKRARHSIHKLRRPFHTRSLQPQHIQRRCIYHLASRRPGNRISCFVRSSTDVWFRLPTNTETRLIMIAAGTGLAPMCAFIQERAAMAARLSRAETRHSTSLLRLSL